LLLEEDIPMKFRTLLLASLMVIVWQSVACAADGKMHVYDSWIREAPPNAVSLAGYMAMENRSGEELSLVSAAADVFAHVMIHQTTHEGGMARMHHQEQVPIPPRETIRFEPNGYHLMLMHPQQVIKSGDLVTIQLGFSDGSEQRVIFEVRKQAPVK
jgi:copper(I)-binding protein